MSHGSDALTAGLVQQASQGDSESFAALYQSYAPRVLRVAYLILGDAGRAEKVTQDVFVQVYHHLDDYCPEQSAFSTWLHRITLNLLYRLLPSSDVKKRFHCAA